MLGSSSPRAVVAGQARVSSEGRGCAPQRGAVRWAAISQRSSVPGKGGVSVIPSSSGVSYFVSTRSTFALDCWGHGWQNCWRR